MGRTQVAIALTLLLSLFVLHASRASFPPSGFVHVAGDHLELNGAPYYFLGTNFWYGMNLGASGALGDRPRLLRELDRLHALGADNLRILAGSEGPDSEPWRITPALQTSPGVYNEDLLRGLDFLLVEMSKRDMKAVVCLGNFWPWSGGMSQYLRWFGAGPIPYPPPQPGGSWSTYQAYTEKFYSNPRAMQAAEKFIRKIVSRINSISGTPYAQDPVIMAWELANEPRGVGNAAAFNQWIDRTSSFIKSIDSNHLVTTGSEGETPSPGHAGMDFVANHRFKGIDYATAHIWVQNWDWYDPIRSDETYPEAERRMKAYLRDHLVKAKRIGKPLVLEEFGLARDQGSFEPPAPPTVRDRYFTDVFDEVLRAMSMDEPMAGVNFWAWAGEARPQNPAGSTWKSGDSFIGDPPHEAQGWYSVYDSDTSTQLVIQKYAEKYSSFSCEAAKSRARHAEFPAPHIAPCGRAPD